MESTAFVAVYGLNVKRPAKLQPDRRQRRQLRRQLRLPREMPDHVRRDRCQHIRHRRPQPRLNHHLVVVAPRLVVGTGKIGGQNRRHSSTRRTAKPRALVPVKPVLAGAADRGVPLGRKGAGPEGQACHAVVGQHDAHFSIVQAL